MNFSKKNNNTAPSFGKHHTILKEMVSKTKITILLLLFTFRIMGVNAQLTPLKKTIPAYKVQTVNTKPTAKKPQKIKGTLLAPNGKFYFFTDKRYFKYDKNNGLEKIANTKPVWKGIPDNFDAVFVNTINNKAYFFKGSKYNRWNFQKNSLDNQEHYISSYWKGVPSNIDAVTNHTNGKIYFFKDDKYYRYDSKLKKVDKVDLIRKNWKGVPNDVAAAFLHESGKVYFFKDDKFYLFNIKSNKVEKSGTIGKDGWRYLDLNKKNFTKKIVKTPTPSTKDNIRLKITLTRIKSVQARDSDDIADFIIGQRVYYRTDGKHKTSVGGKVKVGDIVIDNEYSTIIQDNSNHIHVREGDENHYINNSLVFEITPQEIKDKRAKFNFNTNLGESDGKTHKGLFDTVLFSLYYDPVHVKLKTIAKDHFIDVNIYEVLEYLQNPTSSKYGGNYFKDSRGGKMHEYGAFGDVMWFKKGSNNSLIGHLEFGDNNKETYVRLYYRFELIP